MNDQRLSNLEDQVIELRIEAASIVHLTKSVDNLNENVKILNEYMNKGKGAVAVIFIAASLISALISGIVAFFTKG